MSIRSFMSHTRSCANNDKLFSEFDTIFFAIHSFPYEFSPFSPHTSRAVVLQPFSVYINDMKRVHFTTCIYGMHVYISIVFLNPLLIHFIFCCRCRDKYAHVLYELQEYLFLFYQPVMWKKLPHNTQRLSLDNEI